MTELTPAIDGWFRDGDAPVLVGQRCGACGNVHFPPAVIACRNPWCRSRDLVSADLPRFGRVWSYTTAEYPPPPPYIAADAFEPFVIVAVELDEVGLVVVGQLAVGFGVDDVEADTAMEVVIEPTHHDAQGTPRTMYRWRPLTDDLSTPRSRP